MNIHSKPVKIGLFFLGLIALCGVVLLYRGNDAVAMAKEKKRRHCDGRADERSR